MRHRIPGRHANLNRDAVIARYAKGGSTLAVANEFKVHPKCILYHLKRANVPIRPRAENIYPRGPAHKHWKGGRLTDKQGYVLVTITTGRRSKRRLEHRLVVEQAIGRRLETREYVHHLNGIRNDNRIENLAVTSPKEHESRTLIKALQKRILDLEALIR